MILKEIISPISQGLIMFEKTREEWKAEVRRGQLPWDWHCRHTFLAVIIFSGHDPIELLEQNGWGISVQQSDVSVPYAGHPCCSFGILHITQCLLGKLA